MDYQRPNDRNFKKFRYKYKRGIENRRIKNGLIFFAIISPLRKYY